LTILVEAMAADGHDVSLGCDSTTGEYKVDASFPTLMRMISFSDEVNRMMANLLIAEHHA